jgi:hypothetical protein
MIDNKNKGGKQILEAGARHYQNLVTMVVKSNQEHIVSIVTIIIVLLMVSIGMTETEITTVIICRSLWNVHILQCEFRIEMMNTAPLQNT